MTVFVCAVCGQHHPALPPENPPEKDPAKRAALKAAWDRAYTRWSPRRTVQQEVVPSSRIPLVENRSMLGRLALMWLGFARTHASEGRPEQAEACLETAGKHWERRKFLGSKAERERRHTAVDKAGDAYLMAARYTGVPRVPDTISMSNDGTLYLRCGGKPCKPARHDGLRRGRSFFVVQLFDHEGYYGSVTTTTMKELYEQTAKRSANKEIVGSSLPFKGKWSGIIMDVSAPSDFKESLAPLEDPRLQRIALREESPNPPPVAQPPLVQTQLEVEPERVVVRT